MKCADRLDRIIFREKIFCYMRWKIVDVIYYITMKVGRKAIKRKKKKKRKARRRRKNTLDFIRKCFLRIKRSNFNDFFSKRQLLLLLMRCVVLLRFRTMSLSAISIFIICDSICSIKFLFLFLFKHVFDNSINIIIIDEKWKRRKKEKKKNLEIWIVSKSFRTKTMCFTIANLSRRRK